MELAAVAEKIRSATVQVMRGGPNNRSEAGAGSGFLLEQEPKANRQRVVTNHHVVGGVRQVTVELAGGQTHAGRVTSVDPARDLALIEFDAPFSASSPALTFRAVPAQPGEMAIAIGNPLGFTGAMSKGVVRAVGPVEHLGRNNTFANAQWVQTEIRLAPGNSGGPLTDAQGQVIGINTMIISGRMAARGAGQTGMLALSVPAAAATLFLRNGPPPRLGISLHEVDVPGKGKALLILSIEPDSAAEAASLLIGDILTHANGTRLTHFTELAATLTQTTSPLRLRFLRGNRANTREVTVPWPYRAAKAA